jgi:predicted nucleotidyltransferase
MPIKTDIFDKYAAWKILYYFALHPDSEFYTNELARKLKLSYGICSILLRKFERFGILTKRILGRAHYYRLKDGFLTMELKRFICISQIYEKKIVELILNKIPEVTSIVIYGSYANGTYLGKSDIDILLIAPKKITIDLSVIESRLGKEVTVQIFTLGQWLNMKKKNDGFYQMVVRNHILLHGGELA